MRGPGNIKAEHSLQPVRITKVATLMAIIGMITPHVPAGLTAQLVNGQLVVMLPWMTYINHRGVQFREYDGKLVPYP